MSPISLQLDSTSIPLLAGLKGFDKDVCRKILPCQSCRIVALSTLDHRYRLAQNTQILQRVRVKHNKICVFSRCDTAEILFLLQRLRAIQSSGLQALRCAHAASVQHFQLVEEITDRIRADRNAHAGASCRRDRFVKRRPERFVLCAPRFSAAKSGVRSQPVRAEGWNQGNSLSGHCFGQRIVQESAVIDDLHSRAGGRISPLR